MCDIVGFDYNNKVSVDDIPTIIKRLSISKTSCNGLENIEFILTNIAILNIDLLPKMVLLHVLMIVLCIRLILIVLIGCIYYMTMIIIHLLQILRNS